MLYLALSNLDAATYQVSHYQPVFIAIPKVKVLLNVHVSRRSITHFIKLFWVVLGDVSTQNINNRIVLSVDIKEANTTNAMDLLSYAHCWCGFSSVTCGYVF